MDEHVNLWILIFCNPLTSFSKKSRDGRSALVFPCLEEIVDNFSFLFEICLQYLLLLVDC